MLGACLRGYPAVTAAKMLNESLKGLFLHLDAEAPGDVVHAGGKLSRQQYYAPDWIRAAAESQREGPY